jgi:hypothetical protein
MSKEHSGLLSWPESFRRSRGNLGLAAEMLPGGFSSRALQLSMYGSMVILSSGQGHSHRRQGRHRVQATTTDQKQSSSYPRMPSISKERPLLSVQSEGSNMKRVAALPLRDDAAEVEAPAAQQRRRRRKAMHLQEDNSSDDSAGEEVIVRVDSPSMLSFRQSAAAPPPQDQ